MLVTSPTQMPSQLFWQQNESCWQISATQGSHDASRREPDTHRSWAQQLGPQSPGQNEHVSPGAQTRSPQTGGQLPQSPAQLWQVSPASQNALPHDAGHTPQSAGQLVHVSPPAQLASPHVGAQAPQSPTQLEQSSPGSHVALPHTAPPQVDTPQMGLTCAAQDASQATSQQNGNCAHTCETHGSQPLHRAAPFVHTSCAHGHGAQSPGHVPQSSPMSQIRSPQLPHEPQSNGQLKQSSVIPSQMKSPQPPHGPQSMEQVTQSSVMPSQKKSPQLAQGPQSLGQV